MTEADAKATALAKVPNGTVQTSAEVKGLAHPVKVIVGANDPALNTDVVRTTFLAWYPDAALEVMANAGVTR